MHAERGSRLRVFESILAITWERSTAIMSRGFYYLSAGSGTRWWVIQSEFSWDIVWKLELYHVFGLSMSTLPTSPASPASSPSSLGSKVRIFPAGITRQALGRH